MGKLNEATAEHDNLQDLLAEHQRWAEERAKEALDTPKYLQRQICKLSGISASRMRNWLTRGIISLDADMAREGSEHRLFTGADALRLASVEAFAQLGLSLSWADQLAEYVVDFFRKFMGRVMNGPLDIYYIAWVGESGLEVAGPIYAGNPIGRVDEETAPVGVFFKPLDIGRRVFEALGYTVAYGSSADLRKAAKKADDKAP